MSTLGEKAGAAFLAVGLLAGAEACSSQHNDSKNVKAASFDDKQVEAAVNQYCDQTQAYTATDYSTKVGANLLAPVGTLQDGTTYVFKDKAEDNSTNVAKSLAGNLLGQAVVYTILDAEKGTTSDKIASDAKDLADTISSDTKRRHQVCATVISRVFQTPELRDYQPAHGAMAFQPTYNSSKVLGGLHTLKAPVTSPVKVFTLSPASDSKNKVVDQDISENWGITAEGKVLETRHNEGEVTLDLDGSPVTPTPGATHEPVTQSPSPSPSKQPENGQNTRAQNSSNGQSSSQQSQNRQAKNGGGGSGTHAGTGGGHGGETGGGCNGSCGTGTHGGSGGGSGSTGGCTSCGGGNGGPTGGPTGGGSTPTSTSGPKPAPSTTETVPAPTTTSPVPVPPTTSPSPTPTPKGSEPSCVPNPPYVICSSSENAAYTPDVAIYAPTINMNAGEVWFYKFNFNVLSREVALKEV